MCKMTGKLPPWCWGRPGLAAGGRGGADRDFAALSFFACFLRSKYLVSLCHDSFVNDGVYVSLCSVSPFSELLSPFPAPVLEKSSQMSSFTQATPFLGIPHHFLRGLLSHSSVLQALLSFYGPASLPSLQAHIYSLVTKAGFSH